MRSFFVKTDLLRILFRMVETALPRIRSALFGKIPRYPCLTEANISFAGISLGAIAKFRAGIDAFLLSLTMTDAD